MTKKEVDEKEPVEILADVVSSEELSKYEEIAKTLAAKYGVSKVHIYIGIEPETKERVVCYLKEPNYIQKIYVMDKMAQSMPFAAGDELRDLITLKEESDPRTYLENSAYDNFRLGVVGTCVQIIDVIQNSFKKK